MDAPWPQSARGWLKLAIEAAVWWGVAFGIWLMSLSATSGQEFLVASLASLPCGLAAVVARIAIDESWSIRLGWLTPVLLVPVAILTDAVQVLAAPIANRKRGGRFEIVATDKGGETSEARGRQALAAIFMSISPGSFVMDVDPDSGDMLVHSLAFKGPRMQKAAGGEKPRPVP